MNEGTLTCTLGRTTVTCAHTPSFLRDLAQFALVVQIVELWITPPQSGKCGRGAISDAMER